MEAPLHVPVGNEDGEVEGPRTLPRPEISIVVVSYNTRDLLRRCLATIASSDTARSYETIVVDNASQDGSPDVVASEFPNVRLVRNRANSGYSRAVNQAIRLAKGRYILILNPDIEVLPGAIDALSAHMDEYPHIGIAGGKLLNPDGTLQYSCRTFYTLATLLHRRTILGKLFPNSQVVRRHLMMDWDHASAREVDWMLGACLMVRSQAIQEVGLMDERFFMYFEDVDWCYRMKQHGWGVVYVPDAVMKHVHRRESATGGWFSPRLLAHVNSMFRFFDKWNSLLYRLRKRRDLWLGIVFLVSDAVALNLAFLGAFWLRSLLRGVLQRPVFPLAAYGEFILLLNGVVLVVNALLGLYRHTTSRDLFDDAVNLGKGLLFSTLVLMASTFLARSELHSRFMVAMVFPLAFLTTLAGRGLLALLARSLRHWRYGLTRAVVLGEREAVRRFARRLDEDVDTGYEVVAALPDRPEADERRFRGFWDADGIREVILRNRVAEVLLVRPTLSARELARLVLLCRRDGIRVRLVSGAADFLTANLAITRLLGQPVADLEALPGRTFGNRLRRVGDALAAALFLLPLGPRSWRSALRSVGEEEPHERIHGLGGRTFRRRRVVSGTKRERLAGALGHVLRGELALVGPRPLPPEEVARHDELRVLFDLVRPGVTGPWRLSRGEDLTTEEEISLALSHIQNQSPLEDLKVLLKSLANLDTAPEAARKNP
jgi:GT2 family glycosyltransferase